MKAGDIWLRAVEEAGPSLSISAAHFERYAGALDKLAKVVGPHLSVAELRDLGKVIVIQLTLRYLDSPNRGVRVRHALKLRSQFIQHARKLRGITHDNDWGSPLSLNDTRPYYWAAMDASRYLSLIADVIEAGARIRTAQRRDLNPTTLRAVYVVMELRLATGGKLINRKFPFPKGGRPYYSVAAAFLRASGVKISQQRLRRRVEKARTWWGWITPAVDS